ncbi:MAG: succinate dehydrogenase [Verrucomicrobia bacterium]|nr:MAG: succinate dehydrogenase [Verrucomicrobiota bacterium]
MSILTHLFTSSIGRKFLMALSGLILTGFALGHLVGNFQIFAHPDKINGYAHFLQSLGPALWIVRLVLLAAVVVHVWAAIALTLESRSARGPEKYGVHKWLEATVASRTMRLTGLVVLAFVIYHILHFTVGLVGTDYYKGGLPEYQMTASFSILGFPIVAAGAAVHDVYSMIFIGFSHPIVSGFYILATGLLAVHLWHGVESLFQTIGWRNATWTKTLRPAIALLALFYFLGNLAIPGAIVTGLAQPAKGTHAALAAAAAPTAIATR